MNPPVPHAEKRQTVLTLLRARAAAGERCPTRIEIGNHRDLLIRMAREGHFKIEVGGRNFRVVEIDGFRTSAPEGFKPLYVISKAGKVLAR